MRKFEKNLDVLNKTDTSREKSAEFLNNNINRKEKFDRSVKFDQISNDPDLHGWKIKFKLTIFNIIFLKYLEISLKNQKKNNIFLIKQLEFKYFFIKIKDKPSPLSIGNGKINSSFVNLYLALQRLEKNQMGNVKVFLSTKSKQPNTFNCEIYHQVILKISSMNFISHFSFLIYTTSVKKKLRKKFLFVFYF